VWPFSISWQASMNCSRGIVECAAKSLGRPATPLVASVCASECANPALKDVTVQEYDILNAPTAITAPTVPAGPVLQEAG